MNTLSKDSHHYQQTNSNPSKIIEKPTPHSISNLTQLCKIDENTKLQESYEDMNSSIVYDEDISANQLGSYTLQTKTNNSSSISKIQGKSKNTNIKNRLLQLENQININEDSCDFTETNEYAGLNPYSNQVNEKNKISIINEVSKPHFQNCNKKQIPLIKETQKKNIQFANQTQKNSQTYQKSRNNLQLNQIKSQNSLLSTVNSKKQFHNGQEYLLQLQNKSKIQEYNIKNTNKCEELYNLSKQEKSKPQPLINQQTFEEIKECTFQPKINQNSFYRDRSKSTQRRTVDEFLEDQAQFRVNAETKLQYQRQIRIQEEIQSQRQPRNKSALIEKSQDEQNSIFDRLHNESKVLVMKKEQIAEQVQKETAPFKPKLISSKNLTPKREYDTTMYLYQDARNRERKSLERRSIYQQADQKIAKQSNKKSNEYIVKSCYQQIDNVLHNYGNKIQSIDCFLDVLQQLGYITRQTNPEERQSLEMIFNLLNQSSLNIEKKNLVAFIVACHGILIDNIDSLNYNESILLESSQYGMINTKGQYVINESVMENIKKRFQFLHINKQTQKTKDKGMRESISPSCISTQSLEFRPSINEKSKKLAENYRQSISSQLSLVMSQNQQQIQSYAQSKKFNGRKQLDRDSLLFKSATNFDQLYLQASLLERKKQTKIDEMKLHETDGCTFKPQLVAKNPLAQQQTYGWTINSIYDRVFPRIEKSREKRDKSTEEIDYERFKDQCTFKPTITQSKSRSRSRASTSASKYTPQIKQTKQNDQYIIEQNQSTSSFDKDSMLQNIFNKPFLGKNQNDQKKAFNNSNSSKTGFSNLNASDNNSVHESLSFMNSSYQESQLNRLQNLKSSCSQYIPPRTKNNVNKNTLTQNNQVKTLNNDLQQHLNQSSSAKKFSQASLQEIEGCDEEPLLFANIHIGSNGQTARLVLYEGEDPKLIVQSFCQKYKLNGEVAEKLHELIRSQLYPDED